MSSCGIMMNHGEMLRSEGDLITSCQEGEAAAEFLYRCSEEGLGVQSMVTALLAEAITRIEQKNKCKAARAGAEFHSIDDTLMTVGTCGDNQGDGCQIDGDGWMNGWGWNGDGMRGLPQSIFRSRWQVQLKTKSGVRLANEAMHALKHLSMLPDAEMGLEPGQDLESAQNLCNRIMAGSNSDCDTHTAEEAFLPEGPDGPEIDVSVPLTRQIFETAAADVLKRLKEVAHINTQNGVISFLTGNLAKSLNFFGSIWRETVGTTW